MKKLLSLFILAGMSATYSLAATDGQIYWGHYKGDEVINAIGLGFPEKIFFAQEIPGSNPLLAGKTLKAVRFLCQGTEHYDEAQVWTAMELPDAEEQYSELIDLDVTSLKDSVWNEVAVAPVVIPNEGLWVGWNIYASELTDRKVEYPALVAFPKGVRDVADDEVFWMRATQYMTGWTSSPRYGRLCLQVLVEGEFGEYVVTVGEMEPQVGLAGTEVNVPLKVSKMGCCDITDFDYMVSVDGAVTGEYHIDLKEAITAVEAPKTIQVPIPVGDETKLSAKQITVTKVNGHDNEAEASDAQTTVNVIGLKESARRRTVMEEYTGTWCGWCPRGNIAMAKLDDDFGEDFIGIAVHAAFMDDWNDGESDPMIILPYVNRISQVTGYPYSMVNRTLECDPYGGTEEVNYGIKADVESQQAMLTVADIELTAEWESADSLTINSVASVTFGYNADEASYALAYVLRCDGICHPNDPDYVQSNFYSYFTDDEEYTSNPDFAEYLARPAYITDMVYDHVAVDGYGIDNGLDESITAPLIVGEAQTHEMSIDVDYNELIQDKSRLSLVVMLLDTTSGQVVNAACTTIKGVESQSIEQVGADSAAQTLYYGLDGKPIDLQNHKGLFIKKTIK